MKRIPLVIILWILSSLTLAAQTPIDQTKAVKADGRVIVENVSGSVTVTAWDRTEVQVRGTLGPETEPLVFEVSDGTARIEVHPKKNSRRGGDGTLDIRIPKKARLEVDVVSASVTVKDLGGSADLQTVSGDIDAASVAGDLKAETVSGTVRGEASGRSLRCASVSGSIRVGGASPSLVEMESVSGEIIYDGGLGRGGEMKAETVSGSVEIRLPATVSAEFDVSTFSGNISGDLGEPLDVEKDGPAGKSTSFRTGAGDGRIKVESFSGSVRLVKK